MLTPGITSVLHTDAPNCSLVSVRPLPLVILHIDRPGPLYLYVTQGYTVELQLSGLFGTASNPDMPKFRIMEFFYEDWLHWQSEGRLLLQGVQLKSGPYFNMSNLFTKIYNMLYYTTNLYLQ